MGIGSFLVLELSAKGGDIRVSLLVLRRGARTSLVRGMELLFKISLDPARDLQFGDGVSGVDLGGFQLHVQLRTACFGAWLFNALCFAFRRGVFLAVTLVCFARHPFGLRALALVGGVVGCRGSRGLRRSVRGWSGGEPQVAY